jgi:hypothetical protein
MARERTIRVTMNGDELAKLDELRPPGTFRPAFLRSPLRKPPRNDEVASREEVLSILTTLARDGRVAAAIALERALRGEAPTGDRLDEILGAKCSRYSRNPAA